MPATVYWSLHTDSESEPQQPRNKLTLYETHPGFEVTWIMLWVTFIKKHKDLMTFSLQSVGVTEVSLVSLRFCRARYRCSSSRHEHRGEGDVLDRRHLRHDHGTLCESDCDLQSNRWKPTRVTQKIQQRTSNDGWRRFSRPGSRFKCICNNVEVWTGITRQPLDLKNRKPNRETSFFKSSVRALVIQGWVAVAAGLAGRYSSSCRFPRCSQAEWAM